MRPAFSFLHTKRARATNPQDKKTNAELAEDGRERTEQHGSSQGDALADEVDDVLCGRARQENFRDAGLL